MKRTMMPKKETMALMMALQIPAMPVMTAMMAEPIVLNTDLICRAVRESFWTRRQGAERQVEVTLMMDIRS